MSPDGGGAFSSVVEKQGAPILKGVQHGNKIFTPTYRIKKNDFDKASVSMLHSQSVMKRPAVKEQVNDFVIPAGDNSAESTLGQIKHTTRSFGNIGRVSTRVKYRRNIEALASSALFRNAGLDTVLNALRDYRLAE